MMGEKVGGRPKDWYRDIYGNVSWHPGQADQIEGKNCETLYRIGRSGSYINQKGTVTDLNYGSTFSEDRRSNMTGTPTPMSGAAMYGSNAPQIGTPGTRYVSLNNMDTSKVPEYDPFSASGFHPKVEMMSNMWDVVGLVLANNKPENTYAATAVGILAIGLSRGKATDDVLRAEGKTIGLGIADDLALHRGTGAITWREAGWQKAGLTDVDWGKAFIDKYHFKSSFLEAANKANAIRFEVSSFNPFFHKPGITNFEFNHIISNPSLLQKTTFIKNGSKVNWDGTQFLKP
ncbi:hypothetical protein SAMN05421796_11334 [Chryseobacterium piscicola]|uniref:Uncharacterized protein n=1 Tax=Chryseobacterium piscicola TaxID=551459 RepID=A0A1N7PEU4_9FLAO|nr:hypothetical protein [Chryseobacterium piscicola]PQA89959.1 hypothetical protein B0A70_15365 [Chryseobacterium piscicola]SIT09088.1 hypothetical protein SAMN05421796_11334 [Chryseobacterium piscicola]